MRDERREVRELLHVSLAYFWMDSFQFEFHGGRVFLLHLPLLREIAGERFRSVTGWVNRTDLLILVTMAPRRISSESRIIIHGLFRQ